MLLYHKRQHICTATIQNHKKYVRNEFLIRNKISKSDTSRICHKQTEIYEHHFFRVPQSFLSVGKYQALA